MRGRTGFLGLLWLLSERAAGRAPPAFRAVFRGHPTVAHLRASLATLGRYSRVMVCALCTAAQRAITASGRSARSALGAFIADRHAVVVLCLALAATAFHQWSDTFWWGGSDHLDHLSLARYYLGIADGHDSPWRTPGMAFFHILVGTPWLDTWKGLIAAYALMSVAIPMFVYYTLAWISRPLALLAAALVIVSAIPYAYAKMGANEELFHCLHFLSILLVSLYFRFAGPGLLAGVTGALFALCLVRPVAALYFWVFIAVALAVTWLQGRPFKPLLLAVTAYAALMAGWALANRHSGAIFVPPGGDARVQAHKHLAEAYFGAPVYAFSPGAGGYALALERGPATRRLHEVVLDYAGKNAPAWQNAAPNPDRPAVLFAEPARDPAQFAGRVLSTPIAPYFQLIVEAAYTQLGEREGDRLLRAVAAEHGTAGITGALRYLVNNPMRLLVGGAPPMGNRNFFGLFLQTRFRQEMRRFYSYTTEYRPGASLTSMDIVKPENGPATREIIEAMRLYIRAYPGRWETQNAWLQRHRGRPDELIAEIFRPSYAMETGIYEGFLYESMTGLFGFARADRLYNQAAREVLHTHPFAALIVWDNVLRATLIRTFGDIKSQLDSLPFELGDGIRYVSRNTDYTRLTPGLARELTPEIWTNPRIEVIGKAYAIFHQASFLLVIVAALLLVPALFSGAWHLAAFIALAYLYNVAVISVYGNFGAARYADVFAFLPVLVALIGLEHTRRLISAFDFRTGSWATGAGGAPPPPGAGTG